MRSLIFLFALAAFALVVHAQDPSQLPLNERVLVVYNANGDDSHKVARYYMEKRNIPKDNICKIDTDVDEIKDGQRFEPEVKKPIRACLEKIGKQQIIYIVFSYQTPYNVSLAGRTQAVDQLIADIWDEYCGPLATGRETSDQPYFGRAESQGNVYENFESLAKYRERPSAKTIYSVWRLEGPNAEVAKGLVDKALYAESHGLKGNAYFDIRGPVGNYVDTGYGAGEWDIYRSSVMAKRAGFDTTLDEKPSEFGGAPSQLRCENAALYAGWYSMMYNDAFSWVPGAIGFHLDSASAVNPRAPKSWVAGALANGITVTSGAVSEPYLEGLVHPDQIFLYLFGGANVGDAVLRGTRWLKWMIINVGDPLYTPFKGGIAPYNSPSRQETWFGITPTTLVGGGMVHAQFALGDKGNTTVPVSFKSSNPELVTLPATANVPPQSNGAAFNLRVKSPDQQVNITLTVVSPTESISNTLIVYPILSGLSLSQPAVKGEGSVIGTISLIVPAPDSGLVVTLTSDKPELTVPAELKIASGARRATFSIAAKAGKAEVNATITARIDNASKTAQLRVTP